MVEQWRRQQSKSNRTIGIKSGDTDKDETTDKDPQVVDDDAAAHATDRWAKATEAAVPMVSAVAGAIGLIGASASRGPRGTTVHDNHYSEPENQ